MLQGLSFHLLCSVERVFFSLDLNKNIQGVKVFSININSIPRNGSIPHNTNIFLLFLGLGVVSHYPPWLFTSLGLGSTAKFMLSNSRKTASLSTASNLKIKKTIPGG